jgi:ABC-type bacteriocin/lantibiotic exporter with double-glycine peptidase domain
MDNLFGTFDFKHSDEVFEEVFISAMAKKTRILVTNHLDKIVRCDRIIIMKAGRVYADGPR